jgi:hypothetical protein
MLSQLDGDRFACAEPAAARIDPFSGQRLQFTNRTQKVGGVAQGGSTTFVGQGSHGHSPAVVEIANHVGHRDSHVVIEYFAEVLIVSHGIDWPNGETWTLHVTDYPGYTAVFSQIRAGSHE